MTTLSKAFWATLILMSLPWRALADDATTLRMGGDFTHCKNETAIYSAGFEEFDRHGFGHKFELGAWTDTKEDHRFSPFGSVLLGKRFGDYEGFNLTGFAGIAIIGYTDAALGGIFEFTEEAIVGYKNVGVGYKHISNAGTASPNQGRDYISLTVAFPI